MNPLSIITASILFLASTGALADWAVCAPEGGVCKFSGRHEVSFGAGKAWNTRVDENGVACTAERFGDPAAHTIQAHVTLLPPTQIHALEEVTGHLEAVAQRHQEDRLHGRVLSRRQGSVMPLAPTARAWLDQINAAGLPPPQSDFDIRC